MGGVGTGGPSLFGGVRKDREGGWEGGEGESRGALYHNAVELQKAYFTRFAASHNKNYEPVSRAPDPSGLDTSGEALNGWALSSHTAESFNNTGDHPVRSLSSRWLPWMLYSCPLVGQCGSSFWSPQARN